jgi:HD-GYP domain-containing protein (c-di-GMP phosphodiesterase class II)
MDHVLDTERIIEPINNSEVIALAASHHEKFDGTGYHKGIKGYAMREDQPIVSSVDIFSSLLSKREYKEALSYDEALKILGYEIAEGKADPAVMELYTTNRDIITKAQQAGEEMYNNIEARILGK